MTKGFITLASGEQYCLLAEHLYMTYKLFSNCNYPFYVITDEEGNERLSKIFDGVIVRKLKRNTVDKMLFFTETPFDESVFIDADCSVVNDLNYVFELFEQNGSDISGIGGVKEIVDQQHGIQFSSEAVNKYGLRYDFPNFNGGVYYLRKSELSNDCISFMNEDIVRNYHRYGLLSDADRTMYDEPIVIVGMLKYGFFPVPVESNIMVLVHNAKTVHWDLNRRVCYYPWYEYKVSPSIIHWKVGGTETYTYEKYNVMVKGLFCNHSRFTILKMKVRSYVKYLIYPKLLKVFPGLHNKVKSR